MQTTRSRLKSVFSKIITLTSISGKSIESHYLNGHSKKNEQNFQSICSYRINSLNDSYDVQLHDKMQFLGDDFFLSLLTSELGYPLTRSKCFALHHFRIPIAPTEISLNEPESIFRQAAPVRPCQIGSQYSWCNYSIAIDCFFQNVINRNKRGLHRYNARPQFGWHAFGLQRTRRFMQEAQYKANHNNASATGKHLSRTRYAQQIVNVQ